MTLLRFAGLGDLVAHPCRTSQAQAFGPLSVRHAKHAAAHGFAVGADWFAPLAPIGGRAFRCGHGANDTRSLFVHVQKHVAAS